MLRGVGVRRGRERPPTEDLIRERYRGIRPAPGYPSQPDHTEKRTIFRLLDAEARTGARLTETDAMWPGASVCGLYFAHPEARYFAVGRVGRDQALDYARRKGITVADAESRSRPSSATTADARAPRGPPPAASPSRDREARSPPSSPRRQTRQTVSGTKWRV